MNTIVTVANVEAANKLCRYLARTAAKRTARAEMRARVATEMRLGGSHPAVVREAARRMRSEA